MPGKWTHFETEKSRLAARGLSPTEYEKAVRALCKKLRC